MRRKQSLWVPAVVLAVMMIGGLTLAGCGSSRGTSPQADTWDEPWEVRVESPLDTVTVAEDPYAATSPQSGGGFSESPAEPIASSEVAPKPADPAPASQVFTPGWRVQILASSSMVNAEELAQRARGRFTEGVYVEYEPPLYKVRVGDFMTKAAAKQMVTRAQAEGFDAWVVETLVVRPN